MAKKIFGASLYVIKGKKDVTIRVNINGVKVSSKITEQATPSSLKEMQQRMTAFIQEQTQKQYNLLVSGQSGTSE